MKRENLLNFVTENEMNQVQITEDDWKVIDPEEFLDKHYDAIVTDYINHKQSESKSIWLLFEKGQFLDWFSEKPTLEQIKVHVSDIKQATWLVEAEQAFTKDFELFQSWEGEDQW